MKKLILFVPVLLCLVNSQGIAQKPGTPLWSRLVDVSPCADTIHSIKAQSDDKVVVAGSICQNLYWAAAIGRFDGMGLSDSSFGVNGIVTMSLDSAHVLANALDIQTDGKIVVAGVYYKKWPVSDFLLARFNADGRLDSSFGINGIVLTDIEYGSTDVAKALAIQADGKILAAGSSGSSLALCRYNIDGSLDSTFDVDGKLAPLGSNLSHITAANSVKLQMDGKIVVCCSYLVVRFKTDGSLDPDFGTAGITTLSNSAYDIAIQNDRKIVIAGSQFILQRLDTAGAYDNSFGK
jgi:uncharacterized delta-60 repeat protein